MRLRLGSLLFPLALTLAACKGGGGQTTSETGTESGTSSSSTASGSEGTTAASSSGTQSGSGGSSGAPTTEGPTTGGPGPDTTSGGPSGTSESGGSSSTGTTGGSSGTGSSTGGGSALMFSLIDPQIYSDCMPIVAPDPVHAQWTVVADNTAGVAPASVTITKASIIFDPDGAQDTHAITVAPTMFGPIPAGVSQMFMLQKKDTPGGLPGCSHCGEMVRFVFEWTIDGAPLGGQFDEVMQCAF